MMETRLNRKVAISMFAALLTLTLAACMLSPGKFTSMLDVRKDGRFTFAYVGEIHMLPLAKPSAAPPKFEPRPCHAEDTMNERTCTRAELAQQRKDWQDEQQARARRDREEADSVKMMLGGIDPDDPKAAEELAARLRKQAGWRKVVYKGKGLYDVDFSITGRLDHDFTFPTIERFPMANAFVQIALRQDGTVRIDAPGFGPSGGMMPMQAMMMMGAMADDGKGAGAGPPSPDGIFTIRTDATVLANNTDEGPQADTTGQRLSWAVNAGTPAAPTALLDPRK